MLGWQRFYAKSTDQQMEELVFPLILNEVKADKWTSTGYELMILPIICCFFPYAITVTNGLPAGCYHKNIHSVSFDVDFILLLGLEWTGVLLIANNPAMWSPPTVDSDRNGCVCPPTPPKKKAVQKINFQMCFILISSYIIYQIVFYW